MVIIKPHDVGGKMNFLRGLYGQPEVALVLIAGENQK